MNKRTDERLAAIVATAYAYSSNGNLAYLATLIWALAGIFVANYDSSTRLLAYAAIGASVAVTVATFAGRSPATDRIGTARRLVEEI